MSIESNINDVHAADADNSANTATGSKLPDSKKKVSISNNTGFKLDFTNKSLLNGVIMAEVLERPKYYRRK